MHDKDVRLIAKEVALNEDISGASSVGYDGNQGALHLFLSCRVHLP